MPLNHGYTYTTRVGADGAGMSLEAYLTAAFPHGSLESWRARAEEGELTDASGRALAPGTRLRAGDVFFWHRPPWDEPDAPTDFGVIAADETFAAVDKPSGLPTLPGAGFLEQTLLFQVRRQFPGAVPMHRLGRGTSGLTLFARTEAARRSIQADWQSRRVCKHYLAVAQGITPEHQIIRTPIGPVPHPLLGSVHAACAGGRPSESELLRLAIAGEDTEVPRSVVLVRIATGRPHQIRIHLASIGHPLAGDPLFLPGGRPDPNSDSVPGDCGYLLHAWRLGFRHPLTGRAVELQAPLPAAWKGYAALIRPRLGAIGWPSGHL